MNADRRSRRPDAGFALLLVLVVLAVAAAGLGLRVRSTRAAAERARVRADEVRLGWATRSVAEALGPAVPRLLDRSDADAEPGAEAPRRRRPLPVERRWRLRLAGVDLLVAATDEQAKLDVNALAELAAGEPAAVGAAVARLAGPSGLAVRVAPTPLPGAAAAAELDAYRQRGESDRGPSFQREDAGADGGAPGPPEEPFVPTEPEPPRRYAALGQLFLAAPPASLLGPRPGLGAGSGLTCDGRGRLNWWTAPPPVLHELVLAAAGPDAAAAAVSRRRRGEAPSEALAAVTPAAGTAAGADPGGGPPAEGFDDAAADPPPRGGFEPQGPAGAPADDAASRLAALFTERTDRFGLWVAAAGRDRAAAACRFRVVDAQGRPVSEARW